MWNDEENVLQCMGETFSDTPQFRGENPDFFSANLYQSVSFIYASMCCENINAIHIAMQFVKKIATASSKEPKSELYFTWRDSRSRPTPLID